MNGILLAALLSASPAFGAIGYSAFKHPRGEYSLEYPADWKRTVGVETLALRPPGKKGDRVRLTLERRPVGKEEAPTAESYVAGLAGDPLKKVEARARVKVAGVAAERLSLVETAELYGKHGQAFDGPLREAVVVVARRDGYLVVRLAGVGEEFAKALPEFDRLVAGLKLAPPKK